MVNHWSIPIDNIQVNKVSGCLGQGAYGSVFLGDWLGTPVAVKCFDSSFPDEIKRNVRMEFDTMTRIHHPNVCQLLGYTEEPFQIVMEYFDRGNLGEFIGKKNCSLKERYGIMVDILRGCSYLHNKLPEQVVHRDIKPENLLVSRSGRVKIADFGLSKIINSDNDTIKGGFRCGTRNYMAPEIFRKMPHNEKVDIWSLGVIARGMLWDVIPSPIIDSMNSYDPSERPSAYDLLLYFTDLYDNASIDERQVCCNLF